MKNNHNIHTTAVIGKNVTIECNEFKLEFDEDEDAPEMQRGGSKYLRLSGDKALGKKPDIVKVKLDY